MKDNTNIKNTKYKMQKDLGDLLLLRYLYRGRVPPAVERRDEPQTVLHSTQSLTGRCCHAAK